MSSDAKGPRRLAPWLRLTLNVLLLGVIVFLAWAMRPLVYVAGFFLEAWRMKH